MTDMVFKREKQYSWIRYIDLRIRQNKNFLGFISGQTGSGKSYCALSLAEMIDPEFSVERCIFSGKELMQLINSDKLGKGNVIIWDEAGIDLSNRSWQSTTNKLLNFLLQTFRHRNFILIFTSPYIDFVDNNTRKLFHAEFKTQSIDFKDKVTKIKPQLIQYNSRLGKFYYKYLRVVTGQGDVVPIESWKIPIPSKELIEAYERKKNKFTAELNKNISFELEKEENKDKKPLTELQEKILECWEKGILKQKEIGKQLGKEQPQIAVNEKYMLKKGYNKQNYIK